MSKLQTPKFGKFNQVTDMQLHCGRDGILRVKNGMTLEEYINHPFFIKSRKASMRKLKESQSEFILIDVKLWHRFTIPHSA